MCAKRGAGETINTVWTSFERRGCGDIHVAVEKVFKDDVVVGSVECARQTKSGVGMEYGIRAWLALKGAGKMSV